MERTERQKAAYRQVELMVAVAQHEAASKGEHVKGASEIMERNTPLKALREEVATLEAKFGKVEGRYVRVAGVSYRQKDVEWLAKHPQSIVQLIPEPTNEYDPNAIKVVAIDGTTTVSEYLRRHVGYIPRDVTHIVHAILDAKALIDVPVIQVAQPIVRGEQRQKEVPLGIRILVIYEYRESLSHRIDSLRKR